MLEKGRVVRSLAGRDSGYLLAVLSANDRTAEVCDGKERPLSRPKIKNIRHIEPLEKVLTEDEMRSDRALKKALACVKNGL